MAATLTANVKGTISHTHSNPLDLSTPVDALSWVLTNAFSSGTGANKANLVWSDMRSLAAGATERIDLFDLAISGGAAQLDALGLAFANLALKGFAIQIVDSAGAQIVTPTTTEFLKLGADATSACWTSLFFPNTSAGMYVPPGGSVIVVAPGAVGLAVADTTNHLLRIDNPSAATIYYKIWILGATAGS